MNQIPSPTPKKLNVNSALTGILAAVLVLNLAAMFLYTRTTNARLAEAIELTKPQKATLTLVSAENCAECKKLDPLVEYIKKQNIELAAEKNLSFPQPEAQKLIQNYGVARLPALIFETETAIKAPLKKALENGTRASGDKILIWEQAGAPYYDIATTSVAGLVEATFITDKSCSECYDVHAVHEAILNKFGVTVVNKNTVDIGEDLGKELIEKYQINAVPTVILSGQAKAYESLNSVWKQVGSIEQDGNFIFREMKALAQTYKNVQTGEVVTFENK